MIKTFSAFSLQLFEIVEYFVIEHELQAYLDQRGTPGDEVGRHVLECGLAGTTVAWREQVVFRRSLLNKRPGH